jgi:hypothetical protein
MDRNSRTDSESPPSEAFLFAQALLGKNVPSPSGTQADRRAQREQLAWLASISTEHERQLRCLLADEARARAEREQLKWLASISTTHESQFRSLLAREAEAREAQTRFERFVECWEMQEAPMGSV